MNRPSISFAIANFNGERFLRDAVESALAQRGVGVEVLIVDDRSTDGSWALAQRLAAEDNRVRAFQLAENAGPGGARNHAIDEAQGSWLAVLDGDDLLHPDRSRRLIEEAIRADATMVADDLLVFDHDRPDAVDGHLDARRRSGGQWITLRDYLDETLMYGGRPNLGFLKPMFRLDWLRGSGIRYDARLRIAEDDDVVLRALAAGARYRLVPRPMYFYRKHGSSISHRLSPANADKMLAAADRQRAVLTGQAPAVQAAWRRKYAALRRAWGFARFVDALKRRDASGAARAALATPGALLLLRQPIAAVLGRMRARALPEPKVREADPKAVLFISRQRLMGATNGSSAYLLGLARAAREAGLVPHLLQPSPVLFGRVPFFRLRPEMEVFETIQVRGGRRIGGMLVASRPAIFAGAAHGVATRLLRRLGATGAWVAERKAPYAIAAPWTRDDLLYVARHGRGMGRVAIADYVFQTEALPYLLDPAMRTAIVMHDLFSARAGQFDKGKGDSVAALDQATEIDLLGRADAVLAIQATEAQFVAAYVPETLPVLVPMAIDSVAEPQPGDPDILLFVGSNTAPNVHGLQWFVDSVWPAVRAAAPRSRLLVAGTVGSAIAGAPEGVELLGLVDDLAALYRQAGIVVSPLLHGSGLKIKLVEALAHGKASVVTATTLQGVETLVAGAVAQADDADAFAQAIAGLQRDPDGRAALAAAALAAARRHFGAEAATADFRAWLGGSA
ncbi:glycosyltransferase [Sphingomonas gei]|uniref:Glycosyltransferase n=1 Tax=Sphingomonas gei TaxID=1395960 RepID=A0A4S1XBP1_9SPHN|nr:glycosyltransferase [Sphingomonas gei]TGX53511.1 glycosyltransferase [Sphingomonas gei]